MARRLHNLRPALRLDRRVPHPRAGLRLLHHPRAAAGRPLDRVLERVEHAARAHGHGFLRGLGHLPAAGHPSALWYVQGNYAEQELAA